MSATTISPDRIPTGHYTVDPAHSNVGFEVRHMGIATVRGNFKRFSGTLDATGEAPVLAGTVEVSSIDTGDQNRDAHLLSPEFFDAERHPQISFRSEAAGLTADGALSLTGEITMKGVSKPIELIGSIAENGQDPWGKERIGFEASAPVDRRDFGLTWNQTLPNGALLLANQVRLVISVSAVREG